MNLVLGIPYKGEDVNLCTAYSGFIDKVKGVLLESGTDLAMEAVDAVY